MNEPADPLDVTADEPAQLPEAASKPDTASASEEAEVSEPPAEPVLRVEKLSAFYGKKRAVKDVDIEIPARSVTAVIGPSGCGKSTFLRALNRLHETIRGARVEGKVWFRGQNIYAADVDPVLLRRKIGMVFQKPNPFPSMSIRDNVLAGLTLTGRRDGSNDDAIVKDALEGAALWDEVRDSLDQPGRSLSGGQQQRLCIARAIAVEPDVLLMDEPCSALDPIATAKIEALIEELKERFTVVIVTHNMQQARRVSAQTAFFLTGDLIEFTPTEQLFTEPNDERTQDYILGRFG